MLVLRCWRAALPSTFNTAATASVAPSRISLMAQLRSQILRQLSSTSISHAFRSPSLFTPTSLSSTSLSSPRPSMTTFLSSPFPFRSSTQTRSFSASAALGAKRRTYNPSRRVQKRRHGFLARLRTRGGRMILMRRRAKGRKALSW